MDLIQFIGFIISVGALIFLSIRRAREDKRRRENPEEFHAQEQEEARAYKELLHRLELPIPPELQQEDVQQTHAVSNLKRPPPAVSSKGWKAPSPKRLVRSTFQYQANLDARHQKTRIEQRNYQNAIASRDRFKKTILSTDLQPEAATDAYDIVVENTVPRTQTILAQLQSPLEMVLFHEIMSKPKASHPVGRLQGLPWETR